jgi:hypothetical protein
MSSKTGEPFAVFDVQTPKSLRAKQFIATNGPLVRFEEMAGSGAHAVTGLADPDELILKIGGGCVASLDRARAAAVIEILAYWLASGRLWKEEDEES